MKKSSIPYSNNRLPGETTVSSSSIKKLLITGYHNYTKEKIIKQLSDPNKDTA